MQGPPLVAWLLVVLSAATGAYGLYRARAGAAGERRAAYGDALMGLGMAVMALPFAAWAGRPWGAALLAGVFAASGLYAVALYAVGLYAVGLRAVGGRAAGRLSFSPARGRGGGGAGHLHHAVGAFAMVYMVLAMAGGHAGHRGRHHGAGIPLLTGVLLVYFAGYVVRSAAALVPGRPGAAAARPGPSPAGRISMGTGMLTMLLTM
ncbi:DUF5134 domain-containing protein [Streptomyces caatingaensis]|uniref:DUF5134 domain-containing protein n=1 Tax=Streptomyces caatingaensis TaxID=1678637 RepID=A0A0K9XGQ8_9ACTN|nr:DUF5134 domain-containing protein [Streptomyces caatingaensis]KNB52236.1 hypothetical protein AC230_11830 [Streptomyces caatingaensis]